MAKNLAFVLTDQPFEINCTIERDRAVPAGCVRLLFRLNDRVIGRAICLEALAEKIAASDLFTCPRMLGLLVEEKEAGVLGTLVIVVPNVEFEIIRERLREQGNFDVAEAMIHLPAGLIRPVEQLPFDMLGLGRVMRASDLRNHPGHLENEAADMLARSLFDQTYVSAEQRAIDDLLDSID